MSQNRGSIPEVVNSDLETIGMFSQVTLRIFVATLCLAWLVAPLSADEPAAEAIATSGSFMFRLSNGKEITGYTVDEAAAKMILAGNELKLPMNLVESIRFEAANQSRVRVELSNGDSLSGQLVPGQFEVVADWGKAKINSSSLSEIRRVNSQAVSSSATTTSRRENVPAVRVDARNRTGNR
jgi:hypothetical protein